MRDEIMRLADLVSELHVSSDYAHGLKAKIERELRTLARTDHVEDRLGMVPEALKYPNENKFRLIDVFRQEHNFARGWNACRDAMLAAAPAPDQSAGVGGMVSSRHREPCWTCGGKAGESTQRKFMFACAECFRDAQPADADADGVK